MDKLRLDIRYAFRTFAQNPAFAFIAILVLALGIGATTAIFSVVNAVLIRPLPYHDPSRLVAVSTLYHSAGSARTFATVSLNEVERWREASHSFDSLGSFVFSAFPVNVGSQAYYVVAIGADPEFLETLGIRPEIGRNLSGHGSKVKDPSVVISHRFWTTAFHSDPQVLGRTINMDGSTATVAGVLPASFQFPRSDASYFSEDPEMIYAVANIADGWGRDSTQWFAIGRLKQGVSLGQADSEVKTITARFVASDPQLRGMSSILAPLDAETSGSVRPALLLTLGISIVLLLIACTNIMNLLFSRAAQREREMAVRKAVGATTGRLIRQMLTESACLTFLAGAIGIGLAYLSLDALVALSPAHLPLSGSVQIDWTVLGFTFLVCAVASILAGVLPALHRSLQKDTVITAGVRSSASRGILNFQRALMVTQMALGVGLLAAAGLLAHSLYRLSSVDPGFRTQGTIAFDLAFPSGHTEEAPRLYKNILEATRGIPGIISAGWITNPPPETRAGVFIPMSIPGSTGRKFCNFQVSSEDYFTTAGISLLRGRDFNAGDVANSTRVAVVNETLARQYFPGVDPLGRHFRVGWDPDNDREIVGIVRDTHDRGLNVKSFATVYVPYQQFALGYGGVVARAAVTPQSVMPEIRRRVAAVDPSIAIRNITTIEARLHETLDAPRFYTILSVACALMAVLFVMLGLYGLISHAVSRRTSEIGIRMALGASQAGILRGVLRQGLLLAAIGVALGIGLSLAATRLLRNLLFEIQPIDPVTLAIAAAMVILVTLAASYIPARRASQVHPMAALRHE